MKISFEFFPPKTEQGKENILREAKILETLNPDFFSVTYGAGGSTREGTLHTIKSLQQHTSISVAPHLSCIGSSRADIIDILKVYQSLKVKRIVALRGDIPSGMGLAGELRYANELVELIREVTGDNFFIEVAAYPECHPQAKCAYNDFENFKKKVHAGANSAITQYFYNIDAYFYFLDECAKANIHIPIIPGIMPITCYNKLARFSDACGAEIPQWMRKRFDSFHDDVESIKKLGIEVVHNLCEALLAGGAPGLHFYTLNHSEPTNTLLDLLNIPAKKHIDILNEANTTLV